MLVVIALVCGLLVGALAAHGAETLMAKRAWQSPSCPYCTAPYEPIQWSMALSWLLGSQQCKACGNPQRWQRLAGEVLLAVAWALIAARYGFSPRALFAMLCVIPLSMIVVTDLEAKLIPNRIMLPAIGVAAVLGTLFGLPLPFSDQWLWWQALAGGVVGFVAFWLLANVGIAFFGEGALGAGDVKLAAYIGLITGFPFIILALLSAVVLGGVGALVILIARRGTLHTAMPYGPYIALGGIAMLVWAPEIAAWFFG